MKQSIRTASYVTAGVCAGSFAASTVVAQDAKPEEPKPRWETVANVGLSLTRGNSKNLLFSAGIDTTRKWTKDEFLAGAKLSYGDTTTDGTKSTTQQDAKAYGQWNHLFTPRFYGGLRIDGLYDKIANINYRFTVSPLVGYYFIKDASTTLSGEFGPSLVTEETVFRRPGPNRIDKDSYIGLRFGDRFEHKFKGGARIWQTAEWIPQISDFNNWILNAELGVSAPLSKKMDVRLVLQDTYDNVPAVGRLKNDLKLIAGLGYKF